MLPGADDIIYRLNSFMYSIVALQPELHNMQQAILPEGFVIKIERFIINNSVFAKVGCRLPGGGVIIRLTHPGLNKALINFIMAVATGLHAHIMCACIIDITPKGGVFFAGGNLDAVLAEKSGQRHAH